MVRTLNARRDGRSSLRVKVGVVELQVIRGQLEQQQLLCTVKGISRSKKEKKTTRHLNCAHFKIYKKIALQMFYRVANAFNMLLKDTHNAFWWEKLNVNKAMFVYKEKNAAYL